jgi:hypothetical protein
MEGGAFLEINREWGERMPFAQSSANEADQSPRRCFAARCIAIGQELAGSRRTRLIEDLIRKKQNPPGFSAGGSVE